MARGTGNTYDNTVRMLNLVALLSNTPVPLSIDQIADKFETLGEQFRYPPRDHGRREAFNRDKRALLDIGVPVVTTWLSGSEAGVGAYIIDKDEYAPIDFGLTRDEMDALQAAAAIVRIEQPWVGSALQWLGGSTQVQGDAVEARFGSASVPLVSLWSAVQSYSAVEFGYHGRRRSIDPYGIAIRNGAWYVVGSDHASGSQRTFRVDRIEGDVTVGPAGTFARPSEFRVEESLATDPKLFGGGADVCATVRVDANLAATVVAEVGSEAVLGTVEGTGAVEVSVPCGNYEAFRAWLFSMVDRAEVVSPADVRERIVADLRRRAGTS
jgi:predicted DNA-binding transcriptional regulator YafY